MVETGAAALNVPPAPSRGQPHVDGTGVQAGQPSQRVVLPHSAPQLGSKAFCT